MLKWHSANVYPRGVGLKSYDTSTQFSNEESKDSDTLLSSRFSLVSKPFALAKTHAKLASSYRIGNSTGISVGAVISHLMAYGPTVILVKKASFYSFRKEALK